MHTLTGRMTDVAMAIFFTGVRLFLAELPITSRRMYLQSPSMPDASGAASAVAAAALALLRLRGRVEAGDPGLDSIALMTAGNK
jgi:hypothetical protein